AVVACVVVVIQKRFGDVCVVFNDENSLVSGHVLLAIIGDTSGNFCTLEFFARVLGRRGKLCSCRVRALCVCRRGGASAQRYTNRECAAFTYFADQPDFTTQ